MNLDHIDAETRLSVIARRNFHFGIWAGRMLGHHDEALARYALEVMNADLTEAGPDDIIDYVHYDLTVGGYPFTREELLHKLMGVERMVRAELLATD